MSEFRTEHDSMGDVRVPARAYYGRRRSGPSRTFRSPAGRLPPELIHALGLVKLAAATANRDLGKLDRHWQEPAQRQASRRPAGRLPRSGRRASSTIEFPIDVFQTGSGTSSNMNANEVISNRAIELLGGDRFAAEKPIHPNDHVNMGQSTNDMFPTAIHVAVAVGIRKRADSGADAAGRRAGRKGKGRGTRSSRSAARIWPTPRRCGWVRKSAALPGRSRCRSSGPSGPRRRCWNCRPAARPSARASTRIRSSAAAWPRALAQETGVPFVEAAEPFRGQRPARRPGRMPRPACGRSPPRCSTWPTTFAGSAPARAAAFMKSSFPTGSRAARSCRARSIR